MNAIVQPTAREVSLAPGEWLFLNQPDIAYVMQSGEVELYATFWENDGPASRRLFLCASRTGDLIASGFYAAGSMRIIAVAIEQASLFPIPASILIPIASSKDRGPILAAQLDRWLAGMAAILAPSFGMMPADALAVSAGETFTTEPGRAITGKGRVCWLVCRDAGLAYPDGMAVLAVDDLQAIPLLPSVWLEATNAVPAFVMESVQALQTAIWPMVLDALHAHVLDKIESELERGQNLAIELSERRREQTTLTIDRTLSRFAGVLDHAPAWTGAATADEQWLGPFALVCDVLGIDLNKAQREAIGRAPTMEDAARAARLRQRQIALRGTWWRDDFGPFIGFLDEERRPCAVLPAGAGRMRIVDPDGGRDLIVDDSAALRLQPMAHMLYRPFAARPLAFKDVLFLGWRQSARDIYVAVAAAFAMSLLGLATPLAMRLAFDRFIPSHETIPLIELAIGLVFAALIALGFRVAYDMASLRVDGRMSGATQAAVIDRVLRLPLSALRYGSADIAQRVVAADGVRRTVVNVGLSSVAALFALILNGALLVFYAPLGALIAWISFVLLLLVAWFAASRQAEAIKRGEELQSDVNTIIFHFIKGISVLRSTGAEERAFARWGRDFAEMRARAYRSQAVSTMFETCLAGFDVLSMAGVFLILSMMRDLSIGTFISFVASYGIFMGSAMQLARSLSALLNTRSSWARGAPLLRSVPETNLTKRNPGILSGAVEMTNVAFKYGQDLPFVLYGLSMKVAPGEFVALVGVSGSGKSTILQMLLGNRAPLAGTVQYDDVDLSHLDIELVRRQIGVVLQSGRLLPGSIFENIMGSHHGTLDDAWEAARQAGLDSEIKALPMGMHTVLTEASAAFSGGQVQRIMLARALVGGPRIILLDEATSALDNVNQALVTASLARLAVTRIVIAHRLVTVKQANRICVIDKGRIVQTGTYDELMSKAGLFSELAQRQLL